MGNKKKTGFGTGKKPKGAGKKMQSVPKKPQLPEVPAEWLYMNAEEIGSRQIYELFKDSSTYKAEYWEEIDILEIGIPEAGTVDMEEIECEFEDEAGIAFLKEHQIKTVYEVTIMPEHFQEAKAVMEIIMEKSGGFFCGDTEDFQPQVQAVEVHDEL